MPHPVVFCESGKVAAGMTDHVGLIKTCEFTHEEAGMLVKGSPNASLTQEFQTPPPPLANGAPRRMAATIRRFSTGLH